MDINFTKFAMSCAEDAIVQVTGQPLAVAAEPTQRIPDTGSNVVTAAKGTEAAERRCCLLL